MTPDALWWAWVDAMTDAYVKGLRALLRLPR